MRLEWAIPCLSVSVQGSLIAKLEQACFDQLGVAELPAPIEFIVLVRVLGQVEEFGEGAERNVQINLKNPAMEDIITVDLELPSAEMGPEHPEGWEMNMLVPIVVQFTATEEGTHMITFDVNGRAQRCSVPFRVILAEAPQEA